MSSSIPAWRLTIFATVSFILLYLAWQRVAHKSLPLVYYGGSRLLSVQGIECTQASMMIQNTVHYQLDSTEGLAEFAALTPSGSHTLDLGSNGEPYTVALFHQLRCLDIVRDDYIKRKGVTSLGRHCLNYLRQAILCEADTRLEPAAVPDGAHVVKFDFDYVCNDWTQVYDAVERISGAKASA